MNVGERIRYIREWRKYSRKELARIAGISEDGLKKIERSQRKGSKPSTIKRIANALGVSIEILYYEDEARVMEALSRLDFQGVNISEGLDVLKTAIGVVSKDEIIVPQLNNPEWWILQGDLANVRGEVDPALEYYKMALNLLPKDYRWARYSLEKVTQMYIDRGDFDNADIVSSEVLNASKDWEPYEINRDLINGLLAEKQGWIENYRGRSSKAVEYFRKALDVAKRWGDLRLESTCHHFLGRATIEGYSHLFYPELFQSFKPNNASLMQGLAELRKAEEMDAKSDLNVAFGILWEVLGLLILGQDNDAKRLIQKGIALSDGDTLHARFLIEHHRIGTLEAKYNWSRHEIDEISEAITEVLETLSSVPYSYAYVRGIITFLCARFLAETFRRINSERKKCVDLCIISLLLYPEPEHVLNKASLQLLTRFIHAMEDREFISYRSELPVRMAYYADDFKRLKKFPSPSLVLVNTVLELVKAMGKDQGKKLGDEAFNP